MRQNNGASETLAVFYRVATAADTSVTSYTFSLGASVGAAGAILRYTGADPSTPIDVSGSNTNTNNTATLGQRRFQVVRVPQYDNPTVTGQITASAWNGSTGGIVAVDVPGTLNFSGGSVNVGAKGFRGGGGEQLQGAASGSGLANTDYRSPASLAANGNKGEGVAGSPDKMYDGTGTLATGSGYPDGTNPNASRARGAPGNAGGGGTDDRPEGGTTGYNDENSGGGGNGGGGGGGAGGSVLVFARTGALTSLTINANGAIGTNADPTGVTHGPGGGGAGGVIYLSSAASSTNVGGGANGTTTTAASAYGATPGASGAANTSLTEAQIPGVTSGATCKATLASVAGFWATVEDAQVVLYWETSSELGTMGFHVERLNPVGGDYERLNETLLPALITSPQGGRYRFVDPTGWPYEPATYRLVEQEVWGGTRAHGPYTVTPLDTREQFAQAASMAPPQAEDAGQSYDDPAQGYYAEFHALSNPQRARSAAAAAPVAGKSKPATGAAQIPIRLDGLIYVGAAELAEALGSTEDDLRKLLRKGKLDLTTAGKDVAWLAAANDAGILFYGEAIDSLYTLDNIYRVRQSQKGTLMAESGERAPEPVATEAFDDTIAVERDAFPATVVATDPESDYWYWEGFIGGNDPNWNAKRFTVNLPDVAGGGTLKVFLRGAGTGAHPARVSVNDRPLGEGTWSDLTDYELRLPVTGAQLQSGDNIVEVRALGSTENLFYLDRIAVQYRRLTRAANDTLSLTAERNGPLAVDGFSTADVYVFDISDPKKPVYLTATTVTPSAMGQSVTFKARRGGRYLALTTDAIRTAVPAPMTPGDLLASRERVDYLVIAPPALQHAAQKLADYRQSRGLRSRLVGTDEIYASVSWGIASPHAVRGFIRQAVRAWGVRYVALVGTGSLDYRDLGGRGEPQAPTLMTSTPYGLFGCDNCLADFDGDGAHPGSERGGTPNVPGQDQRLRSKQGSAGPSRGDAVGRQAGSRRRLFPPRQRPSGGAAAIGDARHPDLS